MNLRSTITRVIAVLIIWSGTNPLFAQEEYGEVIDKIVAKVDDYVILKSDVEKVYLDMLTRGGSANEYEKCNILESIITDKMLLAQAEIDSVYVNDLEVAFELDRRMSYFLSQFGGSQEELEEYYGKSLDQIQEEISDELKDQLTVTRMREQITSEVTVTPSEIKKFYNKIPKDSLPYFSEEVTVAQIVKIPDLSFEEKEKTRSFLLDLKQQVLSGADFGALALKYSQDPGSASNGGAYPNFIKRGEFVPEFEAEAFRLKKDEISDPVETDFGFHMIQLIDRRGNEYRVRHILISPRVTQDDINRAKQELDSIRNLIIRDSLSFEQLAKDLSDEKLTGQNGGYFTDPTGSDRISVEQLDPDVYFSLDSMEVGRISNAMEFRMANGKQAVRILNYKAKYKPHIANLKEDWQKIQGAATNEKKALTEEEWYNDSKGNFFILVDPEFDFCNIMTKK
jgi:peptidyl-prolyl cis-trans isomerase SurA